MLTLTALLEVERHVARGVHSGRGALDALRGFDPDVAPLDIGPPERNGHDIAREIRSRCGEERPRLVAVTGWKKASDRMPAKMAGFDRHVARPCAPGTLLSVLAPPSQ